MAVAAPMQGSGHHARTTASTATGWRLRLAIRSVLLAIVSIFLLGQWLAAQCPVRNLDDDLPPPLPTVNSSTRTGEPRLPESGYLSNTSYANTYFGFVIDLPLPLEGHRLMLPLMPSGQHALLAVGFQEGHRSGTMLITASEPPNPLHEMTESERDAEFTAWAKGEPQRQLTPPDWMTRTNRFYHIVRHTGDVTTVQYWTFINNYLIRVKVSSNDAAFLKRTKQSVAQVKFLCAQGDGTLIDDKGDIVPTPGEGYQGPTIPTSLVDAALDEQPALELIETGETTPGAYRNEDAGIKFSYPTEWEVIRDVSDPPIKDQAAQRARDALGACSLLMVQVALPVAEGAKPDGRLITLRAIDQTCLSLPAPASVTDRLGAEEMAAYLQMLGAVGEVRSTNVVMLGDHLFTEYSGLTGERAEGEPLAERRSEAVLVTRHRKLLLVWTWIAPDTSALAAMPTTSVSFEDTPPIELTPAPRIAKR